MQSDAEGSIRLSDSFFPSPRCSFSFSHSLSKGFQHTSKVPRTRFIGSSSALAIGQPLLRHYGDLGKR
jgi:hypothetical protein